VVYFVYQFLGERFQATACGEESVFRAWGTTMQGHWNRQVRALLFICLMA